MGDESKSERISEAGSINDCETKEEADNVEIELNIFKENLNKPQCY